VGQLAVEVGATVGAGLADLADRGDLRHVVQPSVAVLGEALHVGEQLDGQVVAGLVDGG
jgi:hypothetical protein